VLTPARAASGNAAVLEMLAYLTTLVNERRAHPRDPDTDVLTRLIQGETGDETGNEPGDHNKGERLTETELLHQCIFLLNAGHETTTNLIGTALHSLSEWPQEKARLIANLTDPAVVRSAVEEFLRFESSVQLGNRIATREVAIAGVAMPPDSRVTICIGGANRDPAQFPDPDRLDITREPNKHIAFAFGIHTCAGMNLARLEARVALAKFLARFPDYALSGESTMGGRARFRGFLHLPCIVEPA
jgi:cytochrome P450